MNNIWSSFAALFEAHPRPWTSGVDTDRMQGGVIDADGRLVLADHGESQLELDRAAMIAYAFNELTDDAIRRSDGLPKDHP